MFNKIILSLVMAGLLNLACFSQTMTKTEETIKATVVKIGTFGGATVTLTDGRKIKGYIETIKTDSFVLVTSKKKPSTEIQYSEVNKVKASRRGPGNLEKAAVVAVFVGITVAIFGGIGWVLSNTSDNQ